MSSPSADLSSMAATLEELTQRLGPIAERYQAEQRDDLVSEVQEVERVLGGALRRLARLAATAEA
ncbi:MAG TPA: hypothetical protein VGI06_14440 [Acidimicrobiales bacterium]|jgi:hypothetical protein